MTLEEPGSREDLAHRLASYAADLHFDDIDPESLHAAKALLIDAVGCAIASHTRLPSLGVERWSLISRAPARCSARARARRWTWRPLSTAQRSVTWT